jgi:hypothetical protein
MTPRKLPLFDGFIETPFERRFQNLLRGAWRERSWHVIVAEPGSGKTMGISDLRDEACRQAGMIGGRHYPVLAVTAPKNDPREAALGNLLLAAMGLGARGRWSERKYLLFDLLGQYGVECLICDDAHDLSMPHLIFLKELTDQLFLAFPSRPLGLCLVTAGRGASIPLKDVFDQEDDHVDAISAATRLPSPLLSGGQPYGGRGACYSAGPGAGLSPLFSCIEFAAVDGEHLHVAYSSFARSTKTWSGAHGPPDEDGQDRAEVVLCASRDRCQFKVSRSCRRTAHVSPRQNPCG